MQLGSARTGIVPLLLFIICFSLINTGSVSGHDANIDIQTFPIDAIITQGQEVTGSHPSIAQGGDTDMTPSFYGHAIFQVIIKDGESDSSSGEEIRVEIEAKGENDSTLTLSVPDTREGSAMFEFFLIHKDSLLDLDSLEPRNVALATGMSGAGPRAAPVVTFGSGADLDTESAVFDDVEFEISYNELDYHVQYENTDGEIRLDRNQYGSDNMPILQIVDQDANLNPTINDIFDIEEDQMGLLVDTRGASFEDAVTFTEKNINSGIFEASLTLTEDISGEDPSDIADPQVDFLDWESRSILMSLNEKSNYDEDINNDSVVDVGLDDPEVNHSTSTSDVAFEIRDEDGKLDLTEPLSFSSELGITLTDNDRNKNSKVEDRLVDVITVAIDDAGADRVVVGMKETEDNSGLFELNLRNEELSITFCGDSDVSCPDTSNSVLEFREDDFDEDIVIFYQDSHDDDGVEATVKRTLQLTTTLGLPSIMPIPHVTGRVLVSLFDQDLDDNPRTVDSYSFTLLGTDPAPLKRARGESIGMMAELEVLLDGSIPNYDGSRTFTLRETDVNTGNFTSEIGSEEYQAIAHLADPLGDQEIFELVYHDNMEDPDREASTEYQTGKRISPVGFSRTVVPIPATDIDKDGTIDPPTIIWRVIDPAFNHSPTTENTIPVRGIFFKIVMTNADDEEVVLFDRFTNRLSEIFVNPPSELRETGPNTSIFTAELSFRMGGAFDKVDDWDHAILEITYIEESVFLDDDSNNSASLTFTGHEAILSINQTRVEVGETLYIAVNDNDLNLDDTEVEEFRSSEDASGDYVLAIETEDKNICDELDECPRSQTFRETGPSTGVFQAGFKIGTDIPVSGVDDNDIVQASRILVTYHDQISSGDSDEIERELLVVTGTGTVSIKPQLAGPTTRLNITVTDHDLNRNPSGTDRYDSSDTSFVIIRTDRSEVGKGVPKLVETNPDSGEFSFTLDLVTDDVACGNDDLNGEAFEVVGGSSPTAGVCPGDTLFIEYEDEQDAGGTKASATAALQINTFDPFLVLENKSYRIEDKIVAIISDLDANRNPDVPDTLKGVRVFSDMDAVGIVLSGRETGRNTGIFAISFSTSGRAEENSVHVEPGKNVTVIYDDKFPAEYADNKQDKEFSFRIPILANAQVIHSALALTDSNGNRVDTLGVGKQVALSTELTSNSTGAQPFVAVIEIRDSNGFTVFLGRQSGIVDPESQSRIGISWIPNEPGTYSVRTFVMSSMVLPQILSELSESEIQVAYEI